VANSIEIFDLENNLSIAYFDMGASAENRMGSQVEWSPSGGRLYAITSDDRFTESITVFDFDGIHLTVNSHATDGIDGHSIPRSDLPVPSMLKILDGGRTLVRYLAAGEVHWLDLDRLTLTHGIPLPSGANLSGAKGLAAASAFSADGATLYLANPLTGFVGAVDVQAGSVSRAAFLPSQGPNQNPPQIGDFGQDTVAQSADGSRLYVLDGRMATRLIWTLSVPDLEITAQGTYGDVSGLWPSAAGNLFAFNLSQRKVDIIGRDGALASTIGLPARPHSFLRRGRGLSW
jgi:DNA-binding beta-propeller fold protein YncE